MVLQTLVCAVWSLAISGSKPSFEVNWTSQYQAEFTPSEKTNALSNTMMICPFSEQMLEQSG